MKRIALLILLVFVAGCASYPKPGALPPSAPTAKRGTQKPYQINGSWYYPADSANGFEETGLASWYGKEWHGRKTANGETYDMYAMTAAHKTLPVGTYVKVSRQDNGKEVIVRVNDRGPFVEGRIIDLTWQAAIDLGINGIGLAPVKLVALGEMEGDKLVKKDYQHGVFYVQVGAFTVKDNALRLRDKLEERLLGASIFTFDRGDKVFYRVRVGTLASLGAAESLKKKLAGEGMTPFVVAD